MIKIILACIAFSSLAGVALGWKAAILTDIHIDPGYQDNITSASSCRKTPDGTEVYTDQLAPYGRLGCDPPLVTLELILKRMRDQEQGLDLLFMPGDFIGHGITIYEGQPFDLAKYQKLKEVHTSISELLAKYLPNTLIIPTLGNNDYIYHYQSPFGQFRQEYYSLMSHNWFTLQPQMANRPDMPQINQTFNENGGYYKVKLNQNITVLALNTLMFNSLQEEDNVNVTEATAQLDWLEAQFSNAADGEKFILTFHIYAGQQVSRQIGEDVWNQWHANYTTRYANIVRNYHNLIMLEVTGHDHLADLRYSDQKYSNDTNGTNYSFHNIIVAPALTYRSYSMGGYTVFKVDPETLTPNSLKMVFLPINATKGAHPSQ